MLPRRWSPRHRKGYDCGTIAPEGRSQMPTLGIIGGSGFYEFVGDGETIELSTPFGRPSGPLRVGRRGPTDVVFVSRHGIGHTWSPTNLPYRANIYALKELGVTHVVSISAVGSLREDVPPRSVAVPDQIIDRTLRRDRTFFDGRVVAHVGLAEPFCPVLRQWLLDAAETVGVSPHPGGTYVCIEGPQFSTRAESLLYRTWDAAVIGMTAMPEARLAREAELCYATLALVTDYDVWHQSEEPVSVEQVLGHLRAAVDTAAAVVGGVSELGLPSRWCSCGVALRGAIMSDLATIDPAERDRLGVIAARYLPTA